MCLTKGEICIHMCASPHLGLFFRLLWLTHPLFAAGETLKLFSTQLSEIDQPGALLPLQCPKSCSICFTVVVFLHLIHASKCVFNYLLSLHFVNTHCLWHFTLVGV